jgi:small-conductance mechanosensitive channel
MRPKKNLSGGARWAAVVLALALLAVPFSGGLDAQEVPPAADVTPTPRPTPMPIAAAEISERAAATSALLRSAVQAAGVRIEIETIEQEFEEERRHLDELEKQTSRRLAIDGPASVLEETAGAWSRASARIDEWQKVLKDRAAAIDILLGNIAEEKTVWQLTQSSSDAQELPSEVRKQVVEVLKNIEDVDRSVRANRDAVLSLQARISRSQSRVVETLELQQKEILRRRRGVAGIDSAPLWKAFSLPGVDGGPSEQVSAMWTTNARSVQGYVSEQSRKVIRHGVFLIGFALALVMLRRKAELWARQDRSLDRTVRILDRPLSAALIITILGGDVLHPDAPPAWIDVLALVLLMAFLRLFPRLTPKVLRPIGYVLAVLFFLEQVARLAPDGNLVDRLLLLVLSVTATLTCWWVDRRLEEQRLIEPDGWRAAVRLGNRIAFAAFTVGSLANIIGSVGFANLVIEGTLTSIFTAVLAWVAAELLRAVVRVVLLTRLAKKFSIVRLHADAVLAAVFKLITWSAVLTWVIWTLEEFNVFNPVKKWLGGVLDTPISFGEFSIVPGTVLLFFFLVWLSFKISRLIEFGLETDVLPRMDLPRGVPGAITRLTHYAVIVVGVMVAATAAGLDFSRINLIVGALGVGIGFGLQTVVNNFVSGLILLFERPIRVGDRVQLDQLSGVVTNIGMRASVVRTWQGAEVIVPNANLISSEVINWTLSDDSHRMEIAVGVAYGTDPQTVIDLLVSVAGAHPDVSRDPEPVALFLGFGESSLDFELRAWSGPDFVNVASDLRVAVNRALIEAGFEIPFPQRDVHLRQVDQVGAVTPRHNAPRARPVVSGHDSEGARASQETNKEQP